MKPCYIRGREGLRVQLDGPALSITVPGQAAVLTPLGRISRVVISGEAECSTAALLACAERGITTTFLQHDGSVRAHLFGPATSNNDLFVHLRDLLDRPDWPDLYQVWLDSAASRARRALCRKLCLQPDKISLKKIQTALDLHIEHFVNTGQRRYLQRRLHGLCSNLASETLQRSGLSAARSRYLEQRLDVPGDFADLLSLSLQLPLIEWLSRQPEQGRINDHDIVALFEKNTQRLERIARSLTTRLYSFLVELI